MGPHPVPLPTGGVPWHPLWEPHQPVFARSTFCSGGDPTSEADHCGFKSYVFLSFFRKATQGFSICRILFLRGFVFLFKKFTSSTREP